MNISAHRKKYIYTALLFVVPLALYYIVFSDLQAVRKEAEIIEMAGALDADTLFFRTSLESALNDSLADRSRLEAHFVRQDGVVDFINGLEQMGTSTGVMANISSLGESWKDESGGSLSLSLHVTGDFASVYKYLLLLEQVPQKLVLNDIQLVATENSAVPASIKQALPHTIVWVADIRATVIHYIK